MKKRSDFKSIQLKHFEKNENQYNPDLILKPPVHTKLEIEKIIKLMSDLDKGRIVDFGAGTGRLTIPLAESGFNVIAVDISQKSLKLLEKTAENLSLKIVTSTNLEKHKPYDAVVGCDVLHHINMNFILRNINKALNRRGVIVFSEPGAFNISWYLYFLIRGDLSYEKGVINCSYFNLARVIRNAGFKKIEIKGLGFFPRVFMQNERLCRFNDWLGDLPIIKLFAYRYIIKAYKD
jgi:2-polyprenyl-3-methyl-5-hydroxy-6-metoxy-1,4-benzoquinol methylase